MEELNKKDEERLRLLGSLPLVEAPEGFEGSVRTRIAARRSEASFTRPTLLLALKFVLPLVLLVFLGTFLIVSNDPSGLTEMIPPVNEPEKTEVAVLDEPPIGESVPANDAQTETLRPTIEANRNSSSSAAGKPKGSEDFGLSPDETAVFQPGLDPRKAKVVNARPPTDGAISPIRLLSFIGITSACTPVSCAVTAIKEESPAKRSGLRVGDVIESIGDRPIDSSGHSMIKVDKLGVVRDGKRITIMLVMR